MDIYTVNIGRRFVQYGIFNLQLLPTPHLWYIKMCKKFLKNVYESPDVNSALFCLENIVW